MQFSEYEREKQARQNFMFLWNRICELHNKQINIFQALIRLNPTEGTRAWLGRKDISAKYRGEALEISECEQVKANHIYWGNRFGNKCYKDTSVEVRGEIYFVKTGTKDLESASSEISCKETIKPVFKVNDTWQSWDNVPGKHVEVFSNLLPFEYISSNTVFNAQTPFYQETNNLYDSLTILSANRINIFNDVFNKNNIIINDTSILADWEEIIDNISRENITLIPAWLTDPMGKLKLIFNDWINIIMIGGCIILVFCILGILIYTYSWWSLIFKSIKCCRRRKKYRINNVKTKTESSAPTEPESFILDYIPRSYFIGDEDINLPITSMEINGHNFNALIDTGSNISFASIYLSGYLNSEDLLMEYGSVFLANGSELNYKTMFHATFGINGTKIELLIRLMDFTHHLFDVILGTDFIRQINNLDLEFSINLSQKYYKIGMEKFLFTSPIDSQITFFIWD